MIGLGLGKDLTSTVEHCSNILMSTISTLDLLRKRDVRTFVLYNSVCVDTSQAASS